MDPMTNAQSKAGATEVELSIPEMLAFAMDLHRNMRLDAAAKCYGAVLEADPGNANATHFLGVLMQQRGKGAQALELIRKSIALDPSVAPWHNNLGNVLLDQELYDDAAKAYARCSELDPGNLEVLNNLGILLRRLQRPDEAEQTFRRAITRDPDFADAHTNLAALLAAQERMTESFSHFADALALKPKDINTRRLLAIAYGRCGRFEEGRKLLRDWLEQEPDNANARHFLAAYGGADIPDRASDRYVEEEFDNFAKSFDAKLAALDYRAPQWVGEAVARLLGEPDRGQGILDIGCGTGLCGPYLRPYASYLAGVDLSAKMLELAHARGVYDQLVKSELVAFLQGCDVQLDVVVSADTLIYFGRLDAAFAGARRALVPGGHFVFTLESHPERADFTLQAHGRYSHARAYVEAELERAGFDAIDVSEVVLRFESAQPVGGWLVRARAGEILQNSVKEARHGC